MQAQIRAAQWTRPDTVLPSFDDTGEEMLEAGLYDLIAAFKEQFVAASAAAKAADPTATDAAEVGEAHSPKTLATE